MVIILLHHIFDITIILMCICYWFFILIHLSTFQPPLTQPPSSPPNQQTIFFESKLNSFWFIFDSKLLINRFSGKFLNQICHKKSIWNFRNLLILNFEIFARFRNQMPKFFFWLVLLKIKLRKAKTIFIGKLFIFHWIWHKKLRFLKYGIVSLKIL